MRARRRRTTGGLHSGVAVLRLVPRRVLVVAVTACSLLSGLGYVAAPVLAAARGPVQAVAREVHASVVRERDIELPISASHVVLHWAGNPAAALTIAFRGADGVFGEASSVETDDLDGPDDGPGAGTGRDGETWGQVLVADGATAVRVTADRPISDVTVVALDTRGSIVQQAADAALAVTGVGTAAAAVDEPTIISRKSWGADESYRFDSGGYEVWPRNYTPLQKLIVHHTAGRNNDPNPAATIRAIYYDHAVLRGYGDIGYNWLIDSDGRVYQGRFSRHYDKGEPITGENLAGDPVRGGHARHYNDATVGISLLGNFMNVAPPPAQRTSLVQMLAWIAERHGIDPLGASTYTNPVTGLQKFLKNIAGHRNVHATACPGNKLYKLLPNIRQRVADRIAAHTGPDVDASPPDGVLSPMLSPTGSSTMTFGLPFDEPVTDLTADDLEVGGSSHGWAVTDVRGSDASYTITVQSDHPTDGTVVLTLAADSVTDLAGNTGPADPLEATAEFATDPDAPSVVIWHSPHRPRLNRTEIDVTVTFSEPVVGLTFDDVDIGGTSHEATPWTFYQDAMLGAGATYGFSLVNKHPADGTVTIKIPEGVTTDLAGNPTAEAEISVLVDRTAPTTAPPRVRLRSDVTYSGSPMSGRLTWSGTDVGGAGIGSYDVERSVDGGSFSIIATGLSEPRLDVGLAAGHTYRFAVRAHDRARNVGGWQAGGTTSTLVRQDTSGALAYSSGWHGGSSSSYSGGSVRYSTTAGAKVRLDFSGRSIAYVATTGPGRGEVKVFVDGSFVTTLDLGGATVRYRRVVWSTSWSSAGSHRLRLVVVGTTGRPRIDLDAVLVLR